MSSNACVVMISGMLQDLQRNFYPYILCGIVGGSGRLIRVE